MKKILVILYGNLEFDGRVQRIVEIAKEFGAVTVIDVVPAATDEKGGGGAARLSVRVRPEWGQLRRHYEFNRQVISFVRRERPDLVFAEDYYTPFAGLLSKLFGKSLFVYDAHELIIPERSIFSLRFREAVWYLLERLAIKHADLVFAANPERAQLMYEHYRLPTVPSYMRNIPKRAITTSVDEQSVMEKYPFLEKAEGASLTVLYQGDVSLKRGVGRFLDAMEFMPDSATFIIAGDGPDRSVIERRYSRLIERGRLRMLGRVSQRLLPAVTRFADVGVVTYPLHGLNNLYCAPNKIFEYLNANVPVVTTSQLPLKNIINTYKVGLIVEDSETPREIATKIQEVVMLKGQLSGLVARLTQQFSAENERSRTVEAVRKLLF
jgi:glycosyltransferase involved in cell wall biosynthesis